VTLKELLQMQDLSLTLTYVGARDFWHADIDGAEIKDGAILRGCVGFGRNPTQALKEMMANILGKRIVLFATCDSRREFIVPRTATLPEDMLK
jgi:hypothetical protein